jgi:hypothetical protein
MKATSPIPSAWTELQDWADAIDVDVPEDRRLLPGALQRFCDEGENVRQGFQRRLVETPGVVASQGSNSCEASIQVNRYPLKTPSEVTKLLGKVRYKWETPDGFPITEAVEVWRLVRELSLGFWYKWDPRPPREWLDARRAWNSYVRDTIQHNRHGLDTELQVWGECARNGNNIVWKVWKEIKDTFKPNTVAEWVHDFALVACEDWIDEGIVWTEHVGFGEEISRRYAIPYFGEGHTNILTTDAQTIVASIRANSEGKNLERFSKNLITSIPPSGKTWEQLIGRTHRPGQKADVVLFDVFAHEPELADSFQKACNDARYLEDTLGMRQKLNYADIGAELR